MLRRASLARKIRQCGTSSARQGGERRGNRRRGLEREAGLVVKAAGSKDLDISRPGRPRRSDAPYPKGKLSGSREYCVVILRWDMEERTLLLQFTVGQELEVQMNLLIQNQARWAGVGSSRNIFRHGAVASLQPIQFLGFFVLYSSRQGCHPVVGQLTYGSSPNTQ
jgi:hypothetical protein